MTKLNFKIYIPLLLSVLVLFQSCNLEEVNDNPGRPSDANVDLFLPNAIAQSAFNQSATSGRMAGIVMQQFRGGEAQQLGYTDYLIGTGVFNSLWRFGIYSGVMKTAKTILEKAETTGSVHYKGIAKVLLAKELAYCSSMFGDVPYSDGFQRVDNFKPKYDTQEEVFKTVETLLNEAIADLSAEDNSPKKPGGDDLIYGGNAGQWIKFAHSLKARYLMLQSKRGASMDAVLAEVEKGFTSTGDNATFKFESAISGASPLAKFGEDRSGTLLIEPAFFTKMVELNDPRRDKYVSINADTTSFNWHGTSNLFWAQRDAAIPMMSYSELMYIKAEAMARSGASAADVAPVLKSAIDANVALVTGAADEAFSSAQSDLSGKSQEEMIQAIIESAYYSLYGHGFQQVWDNYRRTGYPALTPSPEGVNGFNPSGVVPRRWLYPSGEENSNKANMDAAISAQGGHLLDNDIWLFK